MSSTPPIRPLHIGLALAGAGWHPAAALQPGVEARQLSLAHWTGIVRDARDAGFDLVTIEDSFGPAPSGSPRLDALLLASAIAPNVRGIGLVPTVTTTHTEPFHVGTVTASLDHASEGWGGWRVQVSAGRAEAQLVGRRSLPAVDPVALAAGDEDQERFVGELLGEAADVIEVVRSLWDSWEDDAVIRDVSTGRYLDRDKLHRIGFQGERFSVIGPSITPRPPQGQPLVYVLAHHRIPYELAAAGADVVGITPQDDEHLRGILEELAAATGRVERIAPDPLSVWVEAVVLIEDDEGAAAAALLELDALHGTAFASDAVVLAGTSEEVADRLLAWHEAGIDGVRLRPARSPLDHERLAEGVLPRLEAVGVLDRPRDAHSLRSRLGLARPRNRYAAPSTEDGTR